MMENFVLYELNERIAWITLNRPEKRNALSYNFVAELKATINLAIHEIDCKVIVLKSAGETFCSGADLESLQKLQSNTYDENLEDSKHLQELFLMIYESPKPVISMVDGQAFAGGCGLATICDFCFASHNAKFAYTEVKIGFIPAIVMVFLLRKIGEQAARRILLTGDVFDVETAKELGLIHAIYETEILEEKVKEFALRLCKQTSAQSLALTKEMISKVQNLGLYDALQYASEMNAKARASDDCKKGISAFLNKEKLQW